MWILASKYFFHLEIIPKICNVELISTMKDKEDKHSLSSLFGNQGMVI
jgi:hypothetical protein